MQSKSKLLGKQFAGYEGEALVRLLRKPGHPILESTIAKIEAQAPKGYTPYFLARMCMEWKVPYEVFCLLLTWCHGAQGGDSRYMYLIALEKQLKTESFRPKYPSEFIVSRCIEYDEQHADELAIHD